MTVVRYQIYPLSNSLTDVNLDVYDETDNLVSSITMSEVATTGVYRATVTSTSNVWGIVSCPSLGISDIVRINPNIIQSATDLAFLKDIEGGRWIIVGTQMVFYAVDNVTEVARFNLLDNNGNATANMANVTERVRM